MKVCVLLSHPPLHARVNYGLSWPYVMQAEEKAETSSEFLQFPLRDPRDERIAEVFDEIAADRERRPEAYAGARLPTVLIQHCWQAWPNARWYLAWFSRAED